MTFRELKNFCNEIPEEQLDEEAFVWREEDVVQSINGELLSDDLYINVEEPQDGCFHISDLDEEDQKELEGNLRKVYSKGRPVLWENF